MLRERSEEFICFSLRHTNHVVHKHACFYNKHRALQKIGNRVLGLEDEVDQELRPEVLARISCCSELGGLLRHYYGHET